MKPITPYVGAVDTAIRFKLDPPSMWVCLGRTTPWEDENNPPDPSDYLNNPQFINMIVPEEPIVLKRVDFIGLCVPDSRGPILYNDQRYRPVPDSQAVDLLARWVYIRASLDYFERSSTGAIVLGATQFRQVTILSGVTPLPPYKQEIILNPSQVQDWGRMVFVANLPPRDRDPKMRDVLQWVREFRG